MASCAENIIRVYIIEEDSIKIEQIIEELRELSYEYFEVQESDEYMIDLIMGSKWSAPIEGFQKICDTYGCEIIGVSSEFGNGYVEAFDLHSDIFVEDTSNHYIAVEAVPADDGTTLPIEGDENLL